jgi:hypothetical protein
MKNHWFLAILILVVQSVVAQSPSTTPDPLSQFYELPVSSAVIDSELDSIDLFNYDSDKKIWNNYSRITFRYNDDGLLEQAVCRDWDWKNLYWKGETKIDYQYLDKRLYKRTEYFWWNDSANWVKRYIAYYDYNVNYIGENCFYHYISPPMDSKYQKRMLYYNPDWKLTLERVFEHIAYDDSYDEYLKYSYAYDSRGRLTGFIEYRNYFDWEIQSKDVYLYDDDSCTMLDISYSQQSSVLKEWGRYVDKYIYKDNHLVRLVRYPESSKPTTPGGEPSYVMDSYDFRYENGKMVEKVHYIGTQYLNEKSLYYYSKKGDTALDAPLEGFPNPCWNGFTLNQKGIRLLQIHALNGLLVHSERCDPDRESQTIDIARLDKGMYLVKAVLTNGKTLYSKILKR